MRVVELQGADNVRDLGGIAVEGGRAVASGLLYRGSALNALTAADCEELFGRRGIGCIVDLRCGWERAEKPDIARAGVKNLHIPFYDLEIVGIEYTEPAEGTKVVGRDVACDPDRFYRSLTNPLTVGQMRLALEAIFDHALQGVPVYVHCSGGKDRAGIMTLLVLTALGASEEAILDDYLLTNVARDKRYDKEYQRFLGFSGDAELARQLTESHRARPQNLTAFREAVSERYGSMAAFMRDQLRLDDESIARIRAALTT